MKQIAQNKLMNQDSNKNNIIITKVSMNVSNNQIPSIIFHNIFNTLMLASKFPKHP